MLAGAALEVVAAVVGLKTESSLRGAYAAGTHPRPSAAELHALLSAHGQTVTATSVAAAALWLLMAYANYRTQGIGARTVSAALFALDSQSVLQSFHAGNSTATVVVGIVIWFVGLAAIVLLSSRELNQFYQHRHARDTLNAGPEGVAASGGRRRRERSG